MVTLIKKIGQILLDIFFPKFCVLCSRPGKYLCQKCRQKIYYYPFSPIINIDESYVDNILICAKYREPVPQLIKTLKYQNVKGIGLVIAAIMYQTLALNAQQYQAITYIPTSKQRNKMRGFNQAQVIATALAQSYQLPLKKLLIKKPRAKNQALLSEKKTRQESIQNSFAYSQKKQLENKNILIIDDVITTGSTINEACRILKKNGAKKVDAMVFAHK